MLAELFGDYDTVLSCIGFAAGPDTQAKLALALKVLKAKTAQADDLR